MLPKRLQSEMVTQWVNRLYTSGICYPRGYKVKWWHSELWIVYLRYMLPKSSQSELVTQWVNRLYTSGMCYPRGYKVKWWHSELRIVYLRYMLPKRLQSKMVWQWVKDCIPQVYATQLIINSIAVNSILNTLSHQLLGHALTCFFCALRLLRSNSRFHLKGLWLCIDLKNPTPPAHLPNTQECQLK